ncbi:MAG TPA: hypothetical protein VLD86_03960, partial [Ilumatobacteraceae bacterium]|nr:hypothetical protein [Ilumatobacteraceae bacterium]
MTGTNQQFGFSDHDVAITEALDIRRGDMAAFERVMSRECSNQPAGLVDVCRDEVLMQATMVATDSQINGELTMSSLRSLLTGLATIDAPKTLIFVSEGFPIEGQQGSVFELGRLAGLARTSVYALRLDNRMFDVSEPRLPVAPMFDRMLLVEGLDTLAGAARGASFNITGSGTGVFERIESEMSGYYMLGIESMPDDKNGAAHPIRVDVSRRGAIVRSRRILRSDAEEVQSRSPRAAVASALSTPLPLSGLPLKVGAFSLLGPERGKVQMLIHADIGSGYTTSQSVALAYHITDPDGRLVESQAMDARLPPVMRGVPSPLQYVVGASLPPGEYIFKLAAVDGDKVGSVEHPFRAGLSETNDVRFSDLMVGGPIDTRELQRPSISHLVAFGNVHGYVEIYGAGLAQLTAKFELAAAAAGPALADRDVAPYKVGDSRVIFSDVMLTRQLPPGPYTLRAIISDVSGPAPRVVKTLTRGFEVAAPPVLMTSAGGAVGSSTPLADVYLPVGEQMLARPFARLDALRPDVLSR